MNTGHNNAAAIAVDIAKGWRPNYYLTNMAMSYFQAPGMNVAPSIFPILPIFCQNNFSDVPGNPVI